MSGLVLDVVEACFEAHSISVHFTEAQTNEADQTVRTQKRGFYEARPRMKHNEA